MEFIAIDFEKLNDSQLSVCEVGLVVFKDGEEVGTPFHSYINPVGGLSRNDWARKHLSHITDEMILKAPTYNELFPKLQQVIQDKILVVHLKGADLNYIYRLEEHFNLPKLYSKWADTNEIAHNLGKEDSLSGLYRELFNAPLLEHHKALEDARACGRIFECLSAENDITQFIHDEEYLPGDIKRIFDGTTKRHTQFGTATVTPDGLVFNYDKILDKSFFKGKSVVLSGMSDIDKDRIKSILMNSLGAKCSPKLTGKTDLFIIDQNRVGPTKRVDAIRLQQTNGLLVITDDYFWKLVHDI